MRHRPQPGTARRRRPGLRFAEAPCERRSASIRRSATLPPASARWGPAASELVIAPHRARRRQPVPQALGCALAVLHVLKTLGSRSCGGFHRKKDAFGTSHIGRGRPYVGSTRCCVRPDRAIAPALERGRGHPGTARSRLPGVTCGRAIPATSAEKRQPPPDQGRQKMRPIGLAAELQEPLHEPRRDSRGVPRRGDTTLCEGPVDVHHLARMLQSRRRVQPHGDRR
jgi:hypothetical protein